MILTLKNICEIHMIQADFDDIGSIRNVAVACQQALKEEKPLWDHIAEQIGEDQVIDVRSTHAIYAKYIQWAREKGVEI